MIAEGQGALPVLRDTRAVECLKDGSGVGVGERVGGDGGEIGGGGVGLAQGVGKVEGGGGAWGLGVAGIDRKELHGTALHGGGGVVGAAGIDIAEGIAVVGGVRVDEDAGGAVALGEVDLGAAEVAAVADEDDLTLDADAAVGELVEVGGGAVVGVDDLGGDVAGG